MTDMLCERVSGDTGIYDGVVRIMCGEKATTIYLTAEGSENDKPITLDDCLNMIGGYQGEICTVIFDDATSGKVYQFGNYSEKEWVHYGDTCGYA